MFGEGSRSAPLMLVGEQPGDQEDLAGEPFVGPAGKLLDRALEEAGIDRTAAYVTNVVKHFKWEARGKRRIHAKPSWSEMVACRPWLDAEIAVVEPRVLVCLGATAAQAVIGRDFRVSRQRGELVDSALAPYVTATIHPSAILRQRDDESRRLELEAFVDDLRKVTNLDERRMYVLVTIGVYAILVVLLRRPFICLYLIATVVLGYLASLGITELVFRALHTGPGPWVGLDWKVGFFLFVILVAVGEDYNILLVTRVQEEQRPHGPLQGITVALSGQGGDELFGGYPSFVEVPAFARWHRRPRGCPLLFAKAWPAS